MTRTPQRFGPEISRHAIGFQVGAAMLGAAMLPSATGFVAEVTSLQYVPVTITGMAVLLWVLHELVLLVTGRTTAAGAESINGDAGK